MENSNINVFNRLFGDEFNPIHYFGSQEDRLIRDDEERHAQIDCNHVCSGNCRRVGCNCKCGEYHNHQ